MTSSSPPSRLPRLGFLGLGWIGRRRLKALAESKTATVAAIADTSDAALAEAAAIASAAHRCTSFEQLLSHDLDALVIATPSGAHAQQTLRALSHGLHVFCQKPLSRTADEAAQVINCARQNDRLLAVDFSYRHAAAFARALSLARDHHFGAIYAADLTFHNGYGPDKSWCKDKSLAGGGCLIDLGVHLIDLALLALQETQATSVTSTLFSAGREVQPPSDTLEDLAYTSFTTPPGAHARIACSWWSNHGQDATIAATFHAPKGAIRVTNVHGSFFNFQTELLTGNSREVIVSPPDDWEGRAITDFARQLARNPYFDPEVESALHVARILDQMYAS